MILTIFILPTYTRNEFNTYFQNSPIEYINKRNIWLNAIT